MARHLKRVGSLPVRLPLVRTLGYVVLVLVGVGAVLVQVPDRTAFVIALMVSAALLALLTSPAQRGKPAVSGR